MLHGRLRVYSRIDSVIDAMHHMPRMDIINEIRVKVQSAGSHWNTWSQGVSLGFGLPALEQHCHCCRDTSTFSPQGEGKVYMSCSVCVTLHSWGRLT